MKLVKVFESTALLAAGGSDASAWLNTDTLTKSEGELEVLELATVRRATGGTYALEVDISTDGVTVDQTIAVGAAGNSRVTLNAPYFKVRARNTDGVTAFTAHRTVAYVIV